MAQYGLLREPEAPRCKLCRRKCTWSAKDQRYCFLDIVEKRLEVIRPLGPLLGVLNSECDESQPELHIRKLARKHLEQYLVLSQNDYWHGAILDREEFESITPTRTQVYLDGEKVAG